MASIHTVIVTQTGPGLCNLRATAAARLACARACGSACRRARAWAFVAPVAGFCKVARTPRNRIWCARASSRATRTRAVLPRPAASAPSKPTARHSWAVRWTSPVPTLHNNRVAHARHSGFSRPHARGREMFLVPHSATRHAAPCLSVSCLSLYAPLRPTVRCGVRHAQARRDDVFEEARRERIGVAPSTSSRGERTRAEAAPPPDAARARAHLNISTLRAPHPVSPRGANAPRFGGSFFHRCHSIARRLIG